LTGYSPIYPEQYPYSPYSQRILSTVQRIIQT